MSDTVNVQWDQPLEVVHDNGQVFPAVFRRKLGAGAAIDWDCGRRAWEFYGNGMPHPGISEWIVRNVPKSGATRTTEEQLTHYAERCKALVERMATYSSREHHISELFIAADEARAIVASMVEVDGDLVIAREMAVEAIDKPGHIAGGRAPFIRKGEGDDYWEVRLALAAIRRGRALERGE